MDDEIKEGFLKGVYTHNYTLWCEWWINDLLTNIKVCENESQKQKVLASWFEDFSRHHEEASVFSQMVKEQDNVNELKLEDLSPYL